MTLLQERHAVIRRGVLYKTSYLTSAWREHGVSMAALDAHVNEGENTVDETLLNHSAKQDKHRPLRKSDTWKTMKMSMKKLQSELQ